MGRPRRLPLALAALTLLSAGCTTDSPEVPPPGPSSGHDAGGSVSTPAGDGRHASAVGYTLRDLRIPARAGEPGRLSFVIENDHHRPQRRFLLEQTKRVHVYVVRADLSIYRHVHPVMAAGVTWSTALTLPEPGTYNVVTEFVAPDEGGDGDHVLLGDSASVSGDWSPRSVPAADGAGADWGVSAEVLDDLTAGREQAMVIRIRRQDGGNPRLGTYLGAAAHVTGFHVGTVAAVLMHPIGAPRSGDGWTDLEFRTDLPEPGEYVLFLQVRVDDFLHTVPVQVEAH